MPEEDLKKRVTDEEIQAKMGSSSWDEAKEYVHKIGSQRMFEYLQSTLFKKELSKYPYRGPTCSDGGPCTA